MIVFGIETTCDETACAVVEDGRKILSNVVSSQVDMHKEFGGVVPELACRLHAEIILPVIAQALSEADVKLCDLDLIAVSRGPGLVGPLMIGVNAAKTLSWANGIPLIGINHVEAHLYAAMMSHPDEISFPCIGVVVSGGHTAIVLVNEIGSYELIGQTVDDAVGEAFDKAAKILGLPYPGGPEIEKLALKGNHKAFPLKAGRVKGRIFDFSFSGLKTAVLYAAKGQSADINSPVTLLEDRFADLAASFQHAALSDVVKKTLAAASEYGASSIVLGGGVTCNERLKELFQEADPRKKYYWPTKGLSLDNAAMIAGLGYHKYLKKGEGDSLELEAMTSMGIGS